MWDGINNPRISAINSAVVHWQEMCDAESAHTSLSLYIYMSLYVMMKSDRNVLEINSLYPETGLAQVRISAAATTCAERTVSIRQRCTKRAFQGPLSTRTTLKYPNACISSVARRSNWYLNYNYKFYTKILMMMHSHDIYIYVIWRSISTYLT